MHYHNRYLTVSNTNIGANAWWTSVDTEPYALWRLIPESEMTFETVTPTGADSPLVTKFIPADTSNYTACPDGRTIFEITIHHTAGNISIDAIGAIQYMKNKFIAMTLIISFTLCFTGCKK